MCHPARLDSSGRVRSLPGGQLRSPGPSTSRREGEHPSQAPPRLPRVRESLLNWRNVLLLAVPASIVLQYLHAPAWVLFTISCIAVLPLAGYMGEATEHLAARSGPAVGGLLNATFGNAAELIIAIAALRVGLVDLVKASITGSILGNLLLILGLSLVAGGFSRPILRFNRTAVGMSAGMLALAVTGMVFPAVIHFLHGSEGRGAGRAAAVGGGRRHPDPHLSVLAVVLAADPQTVAFRRSSPDGGSAMERRLCRRGAGQSLPLAWPWNRRSWSMPTEHVTQEYSFISETFLGLIIIPIIGNAAEHATAVVVARKGQIDLALQIALGSSTQVALLIAPAPGLSGIGTRPACCGTVHEPGLQLRCEVVAVFLATLLSAIITLDGESHWFEGVQLLALYAMMAVAVFFI